MNEIELKKIWDKLQGKLDVGTFEVFKSKMSDTDSRKRFYDKYHDKLSDKGVELGNYKTYENTLSNKPTSSLPNWVPDCIKNNYNVVITTSPDQVLYHDVNASQKFYFFKNKDVYYTDGAVKTYGNWECETDGSVLVKTPDGQQFSSTNKKWVKQPSTSSQPKPRKRGTPLKSEEYVDVEFKYNYPGDKSYTYGIKGSDWYAKNVNNQKVFNISKDGFQSSVDRLNKQFPDASKPIDNNTNEPNVQVRPKETPFDKMKQDADKLPKDIGFKSKYPTTPKDSIDDGQKVLNKQEEPTIYNIDSNKEEL